MQYHSAFTLKDGRCLTVRSARKEDAEAVVKLFTLTHRQTDFLLAYPEENSYTVSQEAEFLSTLLESPRDVMLLAEVDGVLTGCASVCGIGSKYKVRHRAEFGISVDKAFWNLGIGGALTQAAIACARSGQYTYLELSVVADNLHAIQLYEKFGFREYGRNPKGFRSKLSGYQELVFMGLDIPG